MSRLDKTMVIYGRKPVLEALESATLTIDKIHLAESNKSAGIITQILKAAKNKSIDVEFKSKRELSFISRNSRQDQGVAADIFLPSLYTLDDLELLENKAESLPDTRFILLDGVTNPQNLGMIIRVVAASGIAGLVLPKRGCPELGPLVTKASAGAIFKCPIVRCSTAIDALRQFSSLGAETVGLAASGNRKLGDKPSLDEEHSLNDSSPKKRAVYVMGNETDGLSAQVIAELDSLMSIPMYNEVESLNVAVAAALAAFQQ